MIYMFMACLYTPEAAVNQTRLIYLRKNAPITLSSKAGGYLFAILR